MNFNNQLKWLLGSLVVLLTVVLSTPTQTEAQQVRATIPTFDVTMNGAKIESELRVYPFIVYKDITYFPMTFVDAEFLGIHSSWTPEQGLYIYQIGQQYTQFDYVYHRGQHTKGMAVTASIADIPIAVNGKSINNLQEPYPLLMYRDVTYFPMTWRFGFEEFGWDYSFDMEKGLSIATSRGFSNTKLSSVNYDAVEVGVSTYADLMRIFGEGDESEGAFRVKEPNVRTSFSFELTENKLNPNARIVMSKSIANANRQSVYETLTQTPTVLNSMNYFSIKPGMTLDEVNRILKDYKILMSENMDGAEISYVATGQQGRHYGITLHFKRVNGNYYVQPSSRYWNEEHVVEVYRTPLENAKFTQAVADRIYVGMTYEQLLSVTGYQGYLVSESSNNWQVFDQVYMYVGLNDTPYMLISLANNRITKIDTVRQNMWELRP